MPSTAIASRSRIPTLKYRPGTLLNRAPQSASTEEPLASGSLSKKRGSATLASTSNPRASPNPKARKILRTQAADEHPKRPRAGSPPPPDSARKRPRKSNHPPDFDYVPETEATSLPRRTTRHSLAVQQRQDEEEEDPMDCLTGLGALDKSGDSPEPPLRARSATGFDFTLNGSQLMDGMNGDISSGGLYSDLDEDENEHAETSIARMAGMNEPRASPPSRSRASVASTSRQSTTTPRRATQASNSSRRQSKSPNVSRRTSTATTRQKSTTPRRQSTASTSRRQSTTPTPRRRIEPKTLPPPVLTLTSAQARKEARLAAAQAEAEAKLRASAESEIGGLSVVGEEEEEEQVEGEDEDLGGQQIPDDGVEDVLEEETWAGEEGYGEEEENTTHEPQDIGDQGNESDDPLATAPVFQSPTQPSHTAASRAATSRIRGTPGNRTEATVSGGSARRATPRRHSTATNHVRWTPRSSGKQSTRAGFQDDSGDEGNDISRISSRTRASTSTSRKSRTTSTPRTASGGGRSIVSRMEDEDQEPGLTPRGRNATISRSASQNRSSTDARSRSASKTGVDLDSRRKSRGSPVARGRQSAANSNMTRNASKSASRDRGAGNTTTKSPMRVELVLPAPRRSSLGQSKRPAAPEEENSRVIVQQPTPDQSSLDHSPGSMERLNQLSESSSSRDPTYQPSSEPDHNAMRDGLGGFALGNSSPVSQHRTSSAIPPTLPGDSTVLASFRQEKSRKKDLSSLNTSRASETAGGPNAEEPFGEPLGELEDQARPYDTTTPRMAFDSTTRTAFDLTPGSELRSGFGRLGSYAQSTPYIRGSFGRFNQGEESSPMQAGPSDLALDGNASGVLHGKIPRVAKGKARDGEGRNRTIADSLQQTYRGASVDSSVAVATNSPDRSLRTERISTPRTTRVSLVGASDDDQDDGPPSPSAGRQSFGESINGRNLSDILKLRKQARDHSNDLSSVSAKGMTTLLNDTAQKVLYDSSARSTRGNGQPGEVQSTNISSKSLVIPQLEDVSSDVETELQPNGEDEDERIVRGSVLDDYPLDKHSIHRPQSEGPDYDVVEDYDASVHFDGPSRAPMRRSATPILRSRLVDSEDEEGHSAGPSQIQRARSTSGSDDSSGPEDEPDQVEHSEDEEDDQLWSVSHSNSGAIRSRDKMVGTDYLEHGQSKMRFAPSPSTSARSTSRSLSRPRERHSSYFAGDRTTGLSRSQMMAEASRYEDWEPPARRKLKQRPWTDHDWRMLAHYLRRVQKSQALAKGLSSREELDLMMVNVHAVVDRFVEEEAHGVKLEGEWARYVSLSDDPSTSILLRDRSEITGRAVYLIIKERHKQDGTWKSQALSDPSFSAVLADMTRPRAASEDPDEVEYHPGERVLPAALAELPAPSRAAAAHLLAPAPAGEESAGYVSETPFEDEEEYEEPQEEESEEVPAPSTQISQAVVSQVKKHSPKRSPRRSPMRGPKDRNPPIIVAHQRNQELRNTHHTFNLSASDYSSVQPDQTNASGSSTTMYSRLIGSLSSIIGGHVLAETTGTSVGLPKLKPVSRNPIDLTHDDDDEQPIFPTLNHVPTPARPTPARPKRQKHVEPKLDLPPLQHVSPPRLIEPLRAPRRKPMRRVASVRELTQSFEKIGEENRRAAEAARNRVGYGRSVSGPTTSGRVAAPDFARPAAKGPSPKKTRPLKDNVGVIEISDSSVAVRESVDL
ncbi:hypothetical protein RhiJN_09894 [Ceratobasidium sp. AG-Ba]|nr:hypothetical protein RhiJN_09894 [Ceratobasidium sp. AG-Ba]QRW10651.1 hypothetical protein RhiLY_09650 [Ceratobasidium sp. AG-Ba]